MAEDEVYLYSGGGQVEDKSISHVRVVDGVTEIPESAFEDCDNLLSVVLPHGLIAVEARAFESCSQLESIQLPDTLQSIGMNAFYSTGLTQIDIPDSVQRIDASAFEWAESLTRIRFPAFNCELGDNICSNCGALAEVELPQDLRRIPGGMFFYCEALSRILIPATVESIGVLAFSDCESLAEINLPEGLKRLEESAFQDCSGLKSLDLPDSLTNIGPMAFWGCYSLQWVKLPDNPQVTLVRGFLGSCYSLYKVVFPLTSFSPESRSRLVREINNDDMVFPHVGLKEGTGVRSILFEAPSILWPLWMKKSSILWKDMEGSTRDSILFDFLKSQVLEMLENQSIGHSRTRSSE